jgi:hypothetical protein
MTKINGYEMFFTIKDVKFYTDDELSEVGKSNLAKEEKRFIGKEYSVVKEKFAHPTEDEVLTALFNDEDFPAFIDGVTMVEWDCASVYMEHCK